MICLAWYWLLGIGLISAVLTVVGVAAALYGSVERTRRRSTIRLH